MFIKSIYASQAHTDLLTKHDKRPLWKKIKDFALSQFRDLEYFLTVRYRRHCCSNPIYDEKSWNEDSKGLVVLLHGLRNDPAAWYSQLSMLSAQKGIDLFAPVVHERGMCSLKEAADKLLPTLQSYAQKNPQKPICLLGVSNGARLTLYLEHQLRTRAPSTPVKVSNIAGVHFGSHGMNFLTKIGLAKYFYPKALQEELLYGSATAQSLLENAKAALPEGCAPRDFEFYATREDFSVWNLNSSLPTLGKQEKHIVVHGHSHNSIVTAVARQQINSCLAFLENKTG